jgi:multisubunit Na+/H+ antiporter MnhG subunit
VFVLLGSLLLVLGSLPILRFLALYVRGEGAGQVQSLVFGGVLLIMGFVTRLVGVIADLLAAKRQLLELVLQRVRRLEMARAGAVGPEERVSRD